MEKKLFLCATDLSDTSFNALDWTFELASKFDAQVAILFCYRLIPDAGDNTSTLDLKRGMEKEARARFELFQKKHALKHLVPIQFYSEVGFFTTRIESFMRKTEVNLLVLGNEVIHNFNEFRSLTFDQFVSNCKVPVIVIPEGLNSKVE